MNIKPIEVGCMALVINCKHAGDVVTVVRQLKRGDVLKTKQGDAVGLNFHEGVWEVETAELRGKFFEANLLRIDGHDPDLLKEWDDLEVISKMKGLHHA